MEKVTAQIITTSGFVAAVHQGETGPATSGRTHIVLEGDDRFLGGKEITAGWTYNGSVFVEPPTE